MLIRFDIILKFLPFRVISFYICAGRKELYIHNKAFRHVEILFVQGNQVRTDQNQPHKETNKTKRQTNKGLF